MVAQWGKPRVTAILSTDVVNYDRLVAEDQVGTVELLQAWQTDFVTPAIGKYYGFFLERSSDRMLLEFASLVDAVECAVQLQKGLNERNSKLPKTKHIQMRAGIHVGEVKYDGGAYFGDGVVIASELKNLAGPGEICLSEVIQQNLRGKIDLPFQDMGDREFANAGMMRVFRVAVDDEPKQVESEAVTGDDATERRASMPWVWATIAAVLVGAIGAAALWRFYPQAIPPFFSDRLDQVLPSAEPLALPDKPSIAVLPFVSLRGDQKQDHFSDRITNRIISDLAKFENLIVSPSETVFAYKGKKRVKASHVRDQLGVRYLLAGNVHNENNVVRLNAELIDTTTERTLWTERYEWKLEESHAVQDEIVASVVQVMKVNGNAGRVPAQ